MSGAVHGRPVWRGRANFIVQAPVGDSSGFQFEQLWARRDDASGLYEVCCIPFFVYDLALGDMVSVRRDGVDVYTLDQVERPSGHMTFRVYFGDAADPVSSQSAVLQALLKAPVLVERYSENLVAVDISADDSPQKLADYLAAEEGQGNLTYETGRTAP
ncbi:DUF4265 domain-containing protein [Kribbella solani]|uniref:DUF4265 domain-containing protein n=1 Tax=Kribbella solani TaxID=236067 RepID=UPI0029B93E20|nr:DUF4265 domain-containing protein [Kribbella solani]MDX3004419.1 DUF4265 domain-containing protein [Kribbella solani]